MLEFGTKDSPVFLDTDQLDKPLEYSLDLDMKSKQVDVMTTFNYLIGLHNIQESTKTIAEQEYTIYTGTIDEEEIKIVWRHNANKVTDYEKEAKSLNTDDFNKLYINGDSLIDEAKQITTEFKNKMMTNSGDNL